MAVTNAGVEGLGEILAGQVLQTARINEIFKDGQGCTEVVEEGAFSVRVAIQKAMEGGRTMTGMGDAFDTGDANGVSIKEITVMLNRVFDRPMDLATSITEASPVDFFGSAVRQIGLDQAVDSNKLAISKCLANHTAISVVAENTASDYILDALADFEEGDTDFVRFETEGAIVIVTPKYLKELQKSNLFAFKNVLTDEENGGSYKGTFYGGTKVFSTPKAWFSGKDAILVVAPNAFVKGSGPTHAIKVVDSQAGQGKRLQPLARYGYETAAKAGVLLLQDA